MTEAADQDRIRTLISELGERVSGPGIVYLSGESSIVLIGGGRRTTIDVDLKLDPEPAGIFEAIAGLKDSRYNSLKRRLDSFIRALEQRGIATVEP